MINKGLIIEAFQYLEDLRDSRITNMWGAAPYLAKRLGVPDTPTGTASTLLTTWMESFKNAQDFEARVEWATKKLVI